MSVSAEEILELIQQYGRECAAGGAGYASTDETQYWERIKRLMTGGHWLPWPMLGADEVSVQVEVSDPELDCWKAVPGTGVEVMMRSTDQAGTVHFRKAQRQ